MKWKMENKKQESVKLALKYQISTKILINVG